MLFSIDGALVLMAVQRNQSGMYQCIVSNLVNSSSASSRLTVRPAVPASLGHQKSTFLLVISFACQISPLFYDALLYSLLFYLALFYSALFLTALFFVLLHTALFYSSPLYSAVSYSASLCSALS